MRFGPNFYQKRKKTAENCSHAKSVAQLFSHQYIIVETLTFLLTVGLLRFRCRILLIFCYFCPALYIENVGVKMRVKDEGAGESEGESERQNESRSEGQSEGQSEEQSKMCE